MSNPTVDLNGLVEVSDVQKRGDVHYDLRYLPKREKWEFSQEAFDALDLQNHALREYVSKDGDVVLSVQAEEDSSFMTGRSDSKEKGKLFTNRKLRDHLNQLGHEDVDNFALVHAGNKGDVHFYVVDPWGSRDLSPLLEERMG